MLAAIAAPQDLGKSLEESRMSSRAKRGRTAAFVTNAHRFDHSSRQVWMHGLSVGLEFFSLGGGGITQTFMRTYHDVGKSLNQDPFLGPQTVRHPYKKDPKRDPNLENHPFTLCTKPES